MLHLLLECPATTALCVAHKVLTAPPYLARYFMSLTGTAMSRLAADMLHLLDDGTLRRMVRQGADAPL